MKKIIASFAVISLIFGAILTVVPVGVFAQTALIAVVNTPTVGQNLTVNQPFTFSGSASGGNPTFYGYLWNFGDGTFASATTFNKTYTTVGPKTISLTVTDFTGAQATNTRTINVIGATTPTTPAIDLFINGGNGPITVATGTVATLTWTSANVTVCTASGSWSGSKAVGGGTESTGALNIVGTFAYTLTCTGASSVSDTVTINVQAAATSTAPIISNIRVTDQTQTSAIVRWDTNIVADSRVIYDTVSHPTLGVSPNYGYAFSSPTQDTSPKVTAHAVTLTGLTANTQYFFRVLSQS